MEAARSGCRWLPTKRSPGVSGPTRYSTGGSERHPTSECTRCLGRKTPAVLTARCHDHAMGEFTAKFTVIGIDNNALSEALQAGIDHGGNPIEPFVDPEGGWPLRCCLQDSVPGDHVAIIAWSPFTWSGPYVETGPVVVHADSCPGANGTLPPEFEGRPMTLRPYGNDRMIAYSKVRHLTPEDSITQHVEELLDDPDVLEVHARNPTGGCYAFQAHRHPAGGTMPN